MKQIWVGGRAGNAFKAGESTSMLHLTFGLKMNLITTSLLLDALFRIDRN